MQVPANPKAWYFRENLRVREVRGFYKACDAGEEEGCLFCIAIMAEPLKEGDEVLVLSDFLAGAKAVVAPPAPQQLRDRPWDVMLRFDGTPDGEPVIFDQCRYLAARLPLPPWPVWFPPLSLPDAAELHDAVLRFCSHLNLERREFDWRRFYEVVELVWRKRLPIEPAELGAILVGHGMPRETAKSFSDVYGHGRDILVFAMGRRPVKNRRADYRRTRREKTSSRHAGEA